MSEAFFQVEAKEQANNHSGWSGSPIYSQHPRLCLELATDIFASHNMTGKVIYYLQALDSEIRRINTDGSGDALVLSIPSSPEAEAPHTASPTKTHLPDGIQFDSKRGRLYWTMMGLPADHNNGHLMSCKLDGSDVRVIVPPGQTHTPKQVVFCSKTDWLYWCDREGGAVQRCRPDGSELTTLYRSHQDADTRRTDGRYWPVGIAVDSQRGLLYWTQKGGAKAGVGRILRMKLDRGDVAELHDQKDVEVLFDHLPEPIDLELDHAKQMLYWTDRGDPPYGNTLNKADVSSALKATLTPTQRFDPRVNVIADHFHEAIGLGIDEDNDATSAQRSKVFYVSDLLGTLWKAIENADGIVQKEALFRDRGYITGLCLARV